MEQNKGKRKDHAIPDGPASSDATKNKETLEAVAYAVTTSSAPATATKKVKREEEEAVNNSPPKEELILEWISYSDDEDLDSSNTIRAVSVDEMIRKRITLADCREAMENEKDDCHNRDFVLKLVLREPPSPVKQEKNDKQTNKSGKVLASLNFSWWEDSAKANLMHFNIMSKLIEDVICS